MRSSASGTPLVSAALSCPKSRARSRISLLTSETKYRGTQGCSAIRASSQVFPCHTHNVSTSVAIASNLSRSSLVRSIGQTTVQVFGAISIAQLSDRFTCFHRFVVTRPVNDLSSKISSPSGPGKCTSLPPSPPEPSVRIDVGCKMDRSALTKSS